MEQRAAEYAAAEIARKALLMEEENRLWAIVQARADQAAAEARQKFRWVVTLPRVCGGCVGVAGV
jgi:hypothetical protein